MENLPTLIVGAGLAFVPDIESGGMQCCGLVVLSTRVNGQLDEFRYMGITEEEEK